MPRRHQPPESVNAHRWMVSYADLMTLLFAFFVVLYGASTVNNEKFQQMSQVFVGVFDQPAAINLPQNLKALMSDLSESLKSNDQKKSVKLNESNVALQVVLQALIEKDLKKPRVILQRLQEGLQLEIPADYLFKGKSAQLSVDGEFILTQLAKVLKDLPNFIQVEVFTDNHVNETKPWQLASQQGMTILQWLVLDDVSPLRLSLVNYGPFQPIATNDDEEGMSINRRVLFLVNDTQDQLNRINTVTDEHLSANPKE